MVSDTDAEDTNRVKQKLDHTRMTHRDKMGRSLQYIQNEAKRQDPFDGLDPIQTVHKKIAARFGSNPPRILSEAIRISEEEGDIHNVAHSSIYQEKAPEGQWNRPMPMPMRVNPEKLGGHLGKRVAQGGSDPFMWMDQKYGISKQILDQHRDKPLKISTRSDLIAHDEYINKLNPNKHSVEIHVFGDNDQLNRVIEPGAPSFKRRMKAAKKLRDAGIPVTIVHDKLPFEVMDDSGFNKIMQPLGFDVRQNIINPKDKNTQKKILNRIGKAAGIDLLGMAGGKKK